jgi:hypothetical protein
MVLRVLDFMSHCVITASYSGFRFILHLCAYMLTLHLHLTSLCIYADLTLAPQCSLTVSAAAPAWFFRQPGLPEVSPLKPKSPKTFLETQSQAGPLPVHRRRPLPFGGTEEPLTLPEAPDRPADPEKEAGGPSGDLNSPG